MFFNSNKPINILNVCVYILVFIGIYFIFNATVVISQETYGNPFRFSLAHLSWVFLGLVGYQFVKKVNLNFLRKISVSLLFLSFLLLMLLFVSKIVWGCSNPLGLAPCVNGAIRWLVINPNPLPEIPFVGRVTVQPSEIAKISLVLVLAFTLGSTKIEEKSKIFRVLLYSIPLIFLVFFQPNKSTSFILFFIFFSMMWWYGKYMKLLVTLVSLAVVIFTFFIMFNDYSRQRVVSFLSPSNSEQADYHQRQILISLGSGGFFGVGGGLSRQKFSYLPEVTSDSIFAIIGEEFGFLGSLLVILIFMLMIYQGYEVAKNQKDLTSQLLAVGISSWIGIQSIINISSMAKLSPLTGVPLPLISYGGTSTIIMMLSLGILVNISRKYYGGS